MQTEITQPAVLATDLSLTWLLAAYGIAPDMVMGHSPVSTARSSRPGH